MSIQHYFNRTIRISRLKTSSGFKNNYIATGTTDAHIQRPAQNETSEQFGVYGALYRAWIDLAVDIREGDRVRDRDNNHYEVIAVVEEGSFCRMPPMTQCADH